MLDYEIGPWYSSLYTNVSCIMLHMCLFQWINKDSQLPSTRLVVQKQLLEPGNDATIQRLCTSTCCNSFQNMGIGFGRFDVISTVVWSYYDRQFTCNKFVLHLNSRCKSFCHRKHGLTGAHTPDYLSGNLRTAPLSMKGERKKPSKFWLLVSEEARMFFLSHC